MPDSYPVITHKNNVFLEMVSKWYQASPGKMKMPPVSDTFYQFIAVFMVFGFIINDFSAFVSHFCFTSKPY